MTEEGTLPRTPVPTSPRAFARWFVGVPVRIQTWATLAYLWLTFPLGIAYFVVLVTGFVVGGALVVLLVGVAILVGMVYLVRELAAAERWLADRLLAVDVPTRDEQAPTDPVENLKHVVLDLRTWTGVAFLFSKFAIGIATFVALVTMAAFSLAFVVVPLNYRNVRVGVEPPGGELSLEPSVVFELQTWQVGLTVPFRLTTWYVNSLPEALLVSLFGVALALASLHVANLIGWLQGRYARILLGGSDRSLVRQLLDG